MEDSYVLSHEPQNGSIYDLPNYGSASNRRMMDEYSLYPHPIPMFQQINIPPGYAPEFIGPGTASYLVFCSAGRRYYVPALAAPLHEATEPPGWLPNLAPAGGAGAPLPESSSSDGSVQPLDDNALTAPDAALDPMAYHSPTSALLLPTTNEYAGPAAHTPQENLNPSLLREIEDLVDSGSLSTSSTLSLETQYTPSPQPKRRPKAKALKLHCNVCPGHSRTTFARKADLDRHLVTKHYPLSDRIVDCPWPGCDRKGAENGFRRRDKMLLHQDKVHNARFGSFRPN